MKYCKTACDCTILDDGIFRMSTRYIFQKGVYRGIFFCLGGKNCYHEMEFNVCPHVPHCCYYCLLSPFPLPLLVLALKTWAFILCSCFPFRIKKLVNKKM